MLHRRFFFLALALAAQGTGACDCEAYRLAVSMSLLPNTTLPALSTNSTRVDPDPSGDTSAKYLGCGAVLVTGQAPSLACGMRWGFGVYERLPQCSSDGVRPCGDWGGHPVYRHAWKGNYLWGDFEDNWFLGPGVGNYNAIYGYADELVGAVRAEQIDPAVAKWAAYDVDHWIKPVTVSLRCVPPHGKVAVTAPKPPTTELLSAAAAAAADAVAPAGSPQSPPGCSRLFLSGWASAFSTGLVYSFGTYARVPALRHGGRPVYRHSAGKPVFLYADVESGRWVLGDSVGSATAHAFVDSNATTPLRVAADPEVVRRRWVGVVPGIGTWSAAGVTIDCLEGVAPPITVTTTRPPTLVIDTAEGEPVVVQVHGGDKSAGDGSGGESSVQVVGQLHPADAQASSNATTLAALTARLGAAARAAVRSAHHTLLPPPSSSQASPLASSLELRLSPGSPHVELMLRLPADADASEAYALAEDLGGGDSAAAEQLGWASVDASHVLQTLPPPSTVVAPSSSTRGSGAGGEAAPAASSFPETGELLTGATHAAPRDVSAPCAAAARQFCAAEQKQAGDGTAVAMCLREHRTSLDRGCTTLIEQLDHTIAARDSARLQHEDGTRLEKSDFPAVPAAMGILVVGIALLTMGKRLQQRREKNAVQLEDQAAVVVDAASSSGAQQLQEHGAVAIAAEGAAADV